MNATTLTPQQEKSLANSIGGSSIANILGVGYGTALDEYNNIIYPEKRPDLSDNPHVMAGIYLEPVIAKMAVEKFSLQIRQCNITKFDSENPFMRANIDGKIQGANEGTEFKNRGYFQGKNYGEQGTDQILDSELIQCLWYLMITGWQRWHLVVLIGGYDLRHFVVERNDETEQIIQQIRQQACQFWHENIEKRIPPSPGNNADLKSLYPNDNGLEIEATPEIISDLAELKQLKQSVVEDKARVDAVELRIKSYLGDNSTLTGSDGKKLATWKTQTTNRLDSKRLKAEQPDVAKEYSRAADSRVLRLKS